MNNKIKYAMLVLSAMIILSACSDSDNGGGITIPPGSSLKASSPVTIGMETDYDAVSNSAYLQTAAANASQTTFGYTMKHGAIVQDDGSFDFTRADAQYAAVSAAGLKVWGNTLCWYQNQNPNPMNPLVGIINMPNLLPNADFEEWDEDGPVNWAYRNGSGTYGNFSKGTGTGNMQTGSSSLSMEIIQAVTSLGSSWRLQIESPETPTVVGHNYKVTFWAKASVSGCVAQYEWDHAGSPIYNSANLTTDWAQYTLTFGDGGATPLKATKEVSTIAFDMAYNPVGAIIYIDNVVITDQTAADELAAAAGTPEQRTANIDAALHKWINGVVTHYKGQVVGWDVVTDLFADNGAIRTNANTPNTNAVSDWFVWSEFLGKNTGVAAFKYARDADPNALLFISESGLETNMTKLDSLINYVQWLQGQGTPIDGIGVKMHVAINTTTKAGYDYLFQRLAATGLKIRISELDVSVNGFPANTGYFQLTPQVLGYQSTTYQEVVSSYLKNVPAAQRQDITIWGVNDGNSWLYSNNRGNDYPLLFDDSFAPKPAYGGFLQALKQ